MKRKRLDDDNRKEITEPQQISRSHNRYIPIELTAEILSRLPIKSIGRFISVSKSWRDVITGRRFCSLHAKNKPYSTFYNIARPSVHDSQSQSEHYALEVDEDGNSTTTTIRPRIDEPSRGFRIAGSCNGLLCLLESRPSWSYAITILNPITDESTVVTLPKCKHRTRRRLGEYHKFGFSPSTDEYKVLKWCCRSSSPYPFPIRATRRKSLCPFSVRQNMETCF